MRRVRVVCVLHQLEYRESIASDQFVAKQLEDSRPRPKWMGIQARAAPLRQNPPLKRLR